MLHYVHKVITIFPNFFTWLLFTFFLTISYCSRMVILFKDTWKKLQIGLINQSLNGKWHIDYYIMVIKCQTKFRIKLHRLWNLHPSVTKDIAKISLQITVIAAGIWILGFIGCSHSKDYKQTKNMISRDFIYNNQNSRFVLVLRFGGDPIY